MRAFCARLFGGALLVAGLAGAAAAQDEDPDTSERFRVQGDRLIYDTIALVDGQEQEIRYSDVDLLRDTLRRHKEIKVLELESKGGGHYPSVELAELVIDFELDTHVPNICESSCVTILLGGAKRTMARGARIGFHQLSWGASAIEEYYNEQRERQAWETPFEFAQWMYDDTQTETFNRLKYMIDRGVDSAFAIQSLRRPDAPMWRPYRAVLLAAGVLTE